MLEGRQYYPYVGVQAVLARKECYLLEQEASKFNGLFQ